MGADGSGSKSGAGALNRPVICICNDLFAPSLRALRPIALQLRFRESDPHALASRLQFVAQSEQVDVSISTLLRLVNLSHRDIRTSLNTLQVYIHI